MKYEYGIWPSDHRVKPFIEVQKVDRITGEILKTKRLAIRKTKQWWKQRGFSFNGRLSVGCDGVNRA